MRGCANTKMLDTSNMPAKPVQISIDRELLAKIDRDPFTKKEGRSAFIRKLAEEYFAEQQRREIDEEIRRAYAKPQTPKQRRERKKELDAWIKVMPWPED